MLKFCLYHIFFDADCYNLTSFSSQEIEIKVFDETAILWSSAKSQYITKTVKFSASLTSITKADTKWKI